MAIKNIIFYAPLRKNSPPEKIGGAETGCQKTKAIYEMAGYHVIVINKPVLVGSKLLYLIKMSYIPFKLFYIAKR